MALTVISFAAMLGVCWLDDMPTHRDTAVLRDDLVNVETKAGKMRNPLF